MKNLLPADYYYLLFPALLFVFYFLAWLVVGRDPKIKDVTPQYGPPPGVSPGVARYIETGGTDGTTLAVVATALAAKGVLSIQPAEKKYLVSLLDTRTAVAPEEAALIKALFDVYVPVEPYAVSRTAVVGKSGQNTPRSEVQPARPATGVTAATTLPGASAAAQLQTARQVEIDPAEGPTLKCHIDAIQDTFRKNLEGIYFRHNFIFAGMGMLATFVWGLGTALFLPTDASLFITFWLLMFTSIASLVIGGVWTSRPTHPTVSQRLLRIMLPVVFIGFPGTMIYSTALSKNHGFVLALLAAVVLNSIFFVIMRAPTALGCTTLRHLAGFREFLLRVEQDRLDRMNTPAQRAELMNRFLPYAIALGVREGWGDSMASALSNAIVER